MRIENMRGIRKTRYLLSIRIDPLFQKDRVLQSIPTMRNKILYIGWGVVKIGRENSQLMERKNRPSHNSRFILFPHFFKFIKNMFQHEYVSGPVIIDGFDIFIEKILTI